MKVINLWAGPGAGKSTTAAGLFHKMKLAGLRVELVTEYAKDLVYEKNSARLVSQLAIVGEQDCRLRRLLGQVDFAITDSPLPIPLMYAPPPFTAQWFTNAALGVFHTYNNINFVIDRVKPYSEYGRLQSESEAREVDNKVAIFLAHHNIPFTVIPGDEDAPAGIMRHLFQ